MSQAQGINIEPLDIQTEVGAGALRRIVGSVEHLSVGVDSLADSLLTLIRLAGARVIALLGARIDDRLASAGLLVASPGRLGIVYLPQHLPEAEDRRATTEVLVHAKQAAWRHALSMVQSMVPPQHPEMSAVFRAAGFEFLAELCYLDRSATAACPALTASGRLEFVPYTEASRGLYLDVLAGTYENSRDCPGLAGVRRTEEILETHRATGAHDPRYWMIARLDGAPAGILLLSRSHQRSAFEVVYMGVLPAMRGRGVGDALLAKAVQVCRLHGDASLTLAVDSGNEPARRLYRRWSFQEFDRRRAWFCRSPHRSGQR